MAEIKNRQVLIHLHSSANTPTNSQLNLGELAIKHDTVSGATLFTRTTDGHMAEFISKAAVEGKIKVVNDALTGHVSAYNTKVAALEAADSSISGAVTAVTARVKTLEDALGDGNGTSVVERLAAVESGVTANTKAISDEASARTSADTALGKRIDDVVASVEAMDTAYKAADEQISKDFAAEDAKIRGEFKAADNTLKSTLIGTASDNASADTIYGAKAAANAANIAAVNAQGAADDAAAAAEIADGKAVTAQNTADSAITAITKATTAVTSTSDSFVTVTVGQKDAKLTAVTVSTSNIAKASDLTTLSNTVGTLRTEFDTLSENVTNMGNAYADADEQIRKAFAGADDVVRGEFAAKDAELKSGYENADKSLLGTAEDGSTAVTIYGAKAAAAAASAAAGAAQNTADKALTKIETFIGAGSADTALDTLIELQTYINADNGVTAQLLADVASAQSTADKAVADAANAQTAANTADGKAVAAATAASVADGKAVSAQSTANSAIAAISAATTAVTGESSDKFVKVTVAQDDAKLTGVTVSTSGIAKSSDLSTLSGTVSTLKADFEVVESNYVKAGKITSVGDDIVGTVSNNTITFDMQYMVIDCGEF